MNVPFMSPSTIVNQHSHLHMVCILNWLVARPKQCLNWRCICLGSYITCLLLWCNRMELELPWGPITEVISYIVEKTWNCKKSPFLQMFFFLTFSNMEIFFPFGYPTIMFAFQLWQKLRDNNFRGSWNGKKISISNFKHFQLDKWIIFAIASFAIIEEMSSELI